MGERGRALQLVEPSRVRQPWRELGFAAVAALASVIVAGWRVGAPSSLWDLWGRFDLTTTYAGARTLLTNPWISPNHDLGFPFGQDLANFPAPDLLNLAALKGLVLAVQDPLVASNLFLLLSFGVIVATAFGLFRLVGVARPLAAVLAFSLSLLPWHFDRFTHAFLANYSTVAVGLVLVVAVLDWNLALGGEHRARGRTLLVCLALALYVGLTGTYYAIFITILALVGLAFQVLLGRRGRSLIGAVWFAALPSVVTFAAAYLYKVTAITGASTAVGRVSYESQLYGGDLFTLVRTSGLWSSAYPIPLLETVPNIASSLEADARNSTVGLVAVVATFAVCGMVLAANGLGRRRGVVASLRYWPWLFMVALLFFVVGGFGQAFSVFLGYQIRSWGRLSIVVVMIAYLVLGLLLTAWWRRSRRPRAVLVGSAVVVGVVTILDVVSMGAPFDATAARTTADELRSYGRALDAALPEGCGVLTVPAYQFPEGVPDDGTVVYDPLLPYLYADHPRWSYGGVRGNPAGEWQMAAVSRDVPTMIAQADAAGFCALQVDTDAFTPESDPVLAVSAILGDPVATSPSGRWVTYSLERADAGAWTRDYVLDPAVVDFSFGFGPETSGGVRDAASLVATDGLLVVANPRDDAVAGSVEVDVDASTCPAGTQVRLSTADATTTVTDSGTASLPVTVPADGLTAVHVDASQDCGVTLVNPRLVPAG